MGKKETPEEAEPEAESLGARGRASRSGRAFILDGRGRGECRGRRRWRRCAASSWWSSCHDSGTFALRSDGGSPRPPRRSHEAFMPWLWSGSGVGVSGVRPPWRRPRSPRGVWCLWQRGSATASAAVGSARVRPFSQCASSGFVPSGVPTRGRSREQYGLGCYKLAERPRRSLWRGGGRLGKPRVRSGGGPAAESRNRTTYAAKFRRGSFSTDSNSRQ